ncbi:MAG: hypothetical protein LM580_10615 [Thermofilum sp.]|nr:hypothetical protein [Thermofilum sp.]MCC6065849.1 hypothetical protein [Thermofilum sp.]
MGEALEREELRKAVELARLIAREAERGARWPSLALILNRGARTRKPMRTGKRAGAMPPIVTVIIIVASVVAATLAAYFIYATTARGTRQVMLTVVGQPTLYAGQQGGVELRVTFKNDGTADVDLAESKIYVQDKDKKAVEFTIVLAQGESGALLRPGDSKALKYEATDTDITLDRFPDGAMATLQTKDGYQTSFAVVKP